LVRQLLSNDATIFLAIGDVMPTKRFAPISLVHCVQAPSEFALSRQGAARHRLLLRFSKSIASHRAWLDRLAEPHVVGEQHPLAKGTMHNARALIGQQWLSQHLERRAARRKIHGKSQRSFYTAGVRAGPAPAKDRNGGKCALKRAVSAALPERLRAISRFPPARHEPFQNRLGR
jgi:hypothetical protein